MQKYILALSLMIGVHGYAQKVQQEVFATVDQSVGNIAFPHQGDLGYSHHPFFAPAQRVVKYNAQTKSTTAFPNEKWNTAPETDDHYLSNVLDIRNDENGVVGMRGMGKELPLPLK